MIRLFTENDRTTCIDMLAAGATRQVIGEALGRSKSSICGWIGRGMPVNGADAMSMRRRLDKLNEARHAREEALRAQTPPPPPPVDFATVEPSWTYTPVVRKRWSEMTFEEQLADDRPLQVLPPVPSRPATHVYSAANC